MRTFALQIRKRKAGKRAQRLLRLRRRTVSIAFAPGPLQAKIRLGPIRGGGDAARSTERSKLFLRLQKQAGECYQECRKKNPAGPCHFASPAPACPGASVSPSTPEMRNCTSFSIESELKP